MMDVPPYFKLPTGARLPAVGFGTSVPDKSNLVDTLKHALAAGYRQIDTAWKYGVDEEVGLAVREGSVAREDIFITTKFWPNFARKPELCLDICLTGMKIDYVDLFLMHWPVAFLPDGDLRQAVPRGTPDTAGVKWAAPNDPAIDIEFSESLLPMWRMMEDLQRKGKTRAIGVSNCTIKQLEELLPHVSPDTPLCVNQVETHPWFPNNELIQYCQSRDIVVQAYCPFGGWDNGGKRVIDEPAIRKIAERHGWGLGQVLQSWAVQRGTSPLGRSFNAERMKANLDVKRLTKEEMRSLDALNLGGENGRVVKDWK